MSRGILEQEITKYRQEQGRNRSNSLPNNDFSLQLNISSGKSIDSASTYKCKCGNSRLSSAATPAIASNPIPIPVTTNITKEKRCSCNDDHYRYKLSTWEMYHRIKKHRKKSMKMKTIHKSTCAHSSPTDTFLTQNQCITSSSSAYVIDSTNNEGVKRDNYEPSPTNNKNGSDYDNEEMLWELEM
jgi:hypothetical protein